MLPISLHHHPQLCLEVYLIKFQIREAQEIYIIIPFRNIRILLQEWEAQN